MAGRVDGGACVRLRLADGGERESPGEHEIAASAPVRRRPPVAVRIRRLLPSVRCQVMCGLKRSLRLRSLDHGAYGAIVSAASASSEWSYAPRCAENVSHARS